MLKIKDLLCNSFNILISLLFVYVNYFICIQSETIVIAHVLYLFEPLACSPPPQSPIPAISLSPDALTSPIFKIIRAMPVFYYQHCSIRYIFSYSTLFSYTILIICSYINISSALTFRLS